VALRLLLSSQLMGYPTGETPHHADHRRAFALWDVRRHVLSEQTAERRAAAS